MSSEAIVQVPEGAEVVLLEHAPTAVLREAQTAAAALKDVISKKPKKVVMNGEQYLEFEDWQTCGRFYGITAKEDGDPEYVSLGAYQGLKIPPNISRRGSTRLDSRPAISMASIVPAPRGAISRPVVVIE